MKRRTILKTAGAAAVMASTGAQAQAWPSRPFTDFIRLEREKWGPVVKASGAKME